MCITRDLTRLRVNTGFWGLKEKESLSRRRADMGIESVPDRGTADAEVLWWETSLVNLKRARHFGCSPENRAGVRGAIEVYGGRSHKG